MGVFGPERAGETGRGWFSAIVEGVGLRIFLSTSFRQDVRRNQLETGGNYAGQRYISLHRFRWRFWGPKEPAQQELADFSHCSCVLAHEYFGDLASGRIFNETNWRPSVTTRGRGTSGYSDLNGGFRARKSRRNRN